MRAGGIILIILGLVLTVYTTFSFFTKDEVLDVGRVEISKKEKHSITWSPVLGIVLLSLGGIMLWRAEKINKS